MKLAIELLQQSKRAASEELKQIKKNIDTLNERLSNANKAKVNAENILLEIDEAILKLEGSD